MPFDPRAHQSTRGYGVDRLSMLVYGPTKVGKTTLAKAPCFACGYNGPGYYQPATHPCAERHHRLAKSDTSRPVRPPAPAGPPSLWEWVRAACVSRLGEPRMHTLRGGALQWVLPHTVIWALRDDQANGGVWRVQRDSGETMGATCAAPAELTAALNALAEDVK